MTYYLTLSVAIASTLVLIGVLVGKRAPSHGPAVLIGEIIAHALKTCRRCKGNGKVMKNGQPVDVCPCAVTKFRSRWHDHIVQAKSGGYFWRKRGGKPE